VIKDNSAPDIVGTAIGLNNMMVVLSGALLQPLSGLILKYDWQGVIVKGTPLYTVHNYVLAMTAIPICGILGLIISLWLIRETRCKEVWRQAASI